MLEQMRANWWAIVLRGVLAIVFGVLLFVWPLAGLDALVILFGAYALVDGIFALLAAVRVGTSSDRWWGLLLEGVAGIIAGSIAFLWPGITAVVLLYLIAAWAIITGVFEIVAAIRLRREIESEWLLGLAGVASLLFGVFLIAWPLAGILAVVWVIGAYGVLFGLTMLFLGFRVRGVLDQPSESIGA